MRDGEQDSILGTDENGISEPDQHDPTMKRLEEEIDWYDRKSQQAQRVFKWVKLVQILCAASIPVLVAVDAPGVTTASLGALIVVLEGLQQLNQYQQNWIAYRSTCEALKHEKYLYLAKAGPFSAAADARTLLAERVEGLVSQEHAKWVSTREQTPAPG